MLAINFYYFSSPISISLIDMCCIEIFVALSSVPSMERKEISICTYLTSADYLPFMKFPLLRFCHNRMRSKNVFKKISFFFLPVDSLVMYSRKSAAITTALTSAVIREILCYLLENKYFMNTNNVPFCVVQRE